MKIGQLIQYNKRNISLGKSYIACGGEGRPIPFYKKSKLSISPNQQSEMLWSLFSLHVQVKVFESILKLRCWPLAFTLYKAFYKNKKRFRISFPTSFLQDFWRKIFLMLNFINWPNAIAWLPLLLELLGENMYCNYFCPVCDITNFEIHHNFLIKTFFYITKHYHKLSQSQEWTFNCIQFFTRTMCPSVTILK